MAELSEEVREYFRQLGKANGAKGGKIGGARRAAALTPERRQAIARKAGLANAERLRTLKMRRRLLSTAGTAEDAGPDSGPRSASHADTPRAPA